MNPNEFGDLKDIVAAAVSLTAATSAIGVAWLRRAKWMPPEETVQGGTLKVSGLIAAVAIGILYLQREKLGLDRMLLVGGVAVCVAAISLVLSIYTNTRFSFYRPLTSKRDNVRERTLGGFELTPEAKSIGEKRKMLDQALFDNGGGDKDLVWTKNSQAIVQCASVLGFVALQASGSVALSAIAIGFSM